MKIAWVLPDGVRRQKRIEKNRQDNLPKTPKALTFTPDDASYITQLTQSIRDSFTKKIYEFPQMVTTVIKLALSDQPFPNEVRKAFSNMCAEQSVSKIGEIDEFTHLTSDDKSALIDGNLPTVQIYKQAYMLGNPKFLRLNWVF